MVSVLAVSLLLSQGADYVRSRVASSIRNDPNAHCLWWLEDTAIRYQQNLSGNSALSSDVEFQATQRAFGNWQKVFDSCGSLRFEEGPQTSLRQVGHDPDRSDNENVILYRTRLCSSFVGSSDLCWREDNCGNKYDCWQYNKGTIGLTTTTYSPETGQIFGSDIELNQASFVFTTVDAPVCVPPNFNTSCVATDVENTLTHEIGHLLGLDHAAGATSTMNAKAAYGDLLKRQVDVGTAAFVCDVYPRGGISRDCVPIPALSNIEMESAGSGCSSTHGSAPILVGLLLWGGRRKRAS